MASREFWKKVGLAGILGGIIGLGDMSRTVAAEDCGFVKFSGSAGCRGCVEHIPESRPCDQQPGGGSLIQYRSMDFCACDEPIDGGYSDEAAVAVGNCQCGGY
jgi:hypothetical protein